MVKLKYREFVCVKEPLNELTEAECAEIERKVQEAVLFSLEKRMLLTAQQRELCVRELEQQDIRKRNRERTGEVKD